MKIEIRKGYLFWFSASGQRHREDGPAVEWSNGTKEWYINGVCLSEDQSNGRNDED